MFSNFFFDIFTFRYFPFRRFPSIRSKLSSIFFDMWMCVFICSSISTFNTFTEKQHRFSWSNRSNSSKVKLCKQCLKKRVDAFVSSSKSRVYYSMTIKSVRMFSKEIQVKKNWSHWLSHLFENKYKDLSTITIRYLSCVAFSQVYRWKIQRNQMIEPIKFRVNWNAGHFHSDQAKADAPHPTSSLTDQALSQRVLEKGHARLPIVLFDLAPLFLIEIPLVIGVRVNTNSCSNNETSIDRIQHW